MFFNDTATTEIYTLSLHDALPISVEERHLKGVNEQTVQRFLHKLEELHISATRRREMGDDIEGACGQLRRKTLTTLHDPQGEEA